MKNIYITEKHKNLRVQISPQPKIPPVPCDLVWPEVYLQGDLSPWSIYSIGGTQVCSGKKVVGSVTQRYGFCFWRLVANFSAYG